MSLRRVLACLATLLFSSMAVAGDMLPLKQGIYVPVGRACKGASNAEMVNYWGSNSSIGASQGECTIRKVSHAGNVYTIDDRCRDIQSGDLIEGGLTVLTISSPVAFRMAGVNYRYCGTRVQF